MIYPSGIPVSLPLSFMLNGEAVPFTGTLTHRLVSAGVVVETTELVTEPQTDFQYSFVPATLAEGTLVRYQLFSYGIYQGQTVMAKAHFAVASTSYLTLGCEEVRLRLGLNRAEVPDDYIPVEVTYLDLMGSFSEAFHSARYLSLTLNNQFNRLVLLQSALTLLQALPNLLASREETDNHVFVRLGKGDYSALAEQLTTEMDSLWSALEAYLISPQYTPDRSLFLVGTRVNPLTGS